MATKETIWDMIESMASVWKFPGTDLKITAGAYHAALKDLSDDQIMDAATALLSSWTKISPPKPADLRTIAAELKPLPSRPRALPKPEPNHEQIMEKIRRDTYHVRAITEVLGEKRRHLKPDHWTPEDRRAVSRRQAEMRRELGIPEPASWRS